jgi:hypothetical protein
MRQPGFNPGTLGEFFPRTTLAWKTIEKIVDTDSEIYIMKDINR